MHRPPRQGATLSTTRGRTSDEDAYCVVAGSARAELKEKGSRFLAQCFPVEQEEQARRQVSAIASQHHDASHHCWALVLGQGDAAVRRAQDDGEPAGTAGPPILAAIDKRQLTGTLVVVTRWFGGTKLGTAGLIRCYGGAASQALEAAGIEERYRECRVPLEVEHTDVAAVQRVVFGAGGRFVSEAYGARAHLVALMLPSQEGSLRERLVEATSGRVRFLPEQEES
jgi:uncharacterized YigZ family protein